MTFSIKKFFSKCDQIRKKLRIWSHLLKRSVIENFIFYAVCCNIFKLILAILVCYVLTLSWRGSLSYRNQPIDLQNKSVDWFPFDRDFCHERVEGLIKSVILFLQNVLRIPWNWIYFIVNSTWKFYSELLWNNNDKCVNFQKSHYVSGHTM